MQENITPLQGIFDIESPATPTLVVFEQYMLEIFIVVLVVLCVLLLAIYYFWRQYYSVRGRAKRRLRCLRKNFSHQQVSQHEVVFQLSSILCFGLRLHSLSKNTRLPEKMLLQHERWAKFIDDLSIARYSARENKTQQVKQLLDDAKYLLTHWPMSVNVIDNNRHHD